MRRKSGFTLIELLVVIAIIGILAAILFPVFVKAKDKAKESACTSNMKQIASAMQMYVDNWNGSYPDHSVVPGLPYTDYTVGEGSKWIQQFEHRYKDAQGKPAGIGLVLFPYLKNFQVFKCPSEWKKTPDGVYHWLSYKEGSTYYYKHAIDVYANYHKRPVKISNVSYPTKVSLFYEEAWHTSEWPYLWDLSFWASKSNRPATMRINAIFMDCHVGRVDLPYNSAAAYDGNWFSIGNGWDVSKGARDVK